MTPTDSLNDDDDDLDRETLGAELVEDWVSCDLRGPSAGGVELLFGAATLDELPRIRALLRASQVICTIYFLAKGEKRLFG